MTKFRISDVIKEIEGMANPALQEDYDNSGLQAGDILQELKGVLICLDVTPEVIDEAISRDCNLVVSHHPPVFRPLRKISTNNDTGRLIIKALKHDIAIYTAHTSLDNVSGGVNHILAQKLGLTPLKALRLMPGRLQKIVTFCPEAAAQKVREALFSAGAGHIGNYSGCSFNSTGTGTFIAGEGTDPYVGEIGKIHHENEVRVETIFPDYLQNSIINALKQAHPYEEVAYDIFKTENHWESAGSGLITELPEAMAERDFLNQVKEKTGIPVIRHTALRGKNIKKVAICGGSGSFLISDALRAGADAFLTGDIKYHDFFVPEGRLLLADIGHYESEQFAKQLLYEHLNKKFSNFALLISEVKTNAVNYF